MHFKIKNEWNKLWTVYGFRRLRECFKEIMAMIDCFQPYSKYFLTGEYFTSIKARSNQEFIGSKFERTNHDLIFFVSPELALISSNRRP